MKREEHRIDERTALLAEAIGRGPQVQAAVDGQARNWAEQFKKSYPDLKLDGRQADLLSQVIMTAAMTAASWERAGMIARLEAFARSHPISSGARSALSEVVRFELSLDGLSPDVGACGEDTDEG